jgi:hypothetical protein
MNESSCDDACALMAHLKRCVDFPAMTFRPEISGSHLVIFGDRFLIALRLAHVSGDTMRAHISLSILRCLHDLLAISIGKHGQFGSKGFPVRALAQCALPA